jgi:cytochrome c551/c552
MGAGRRRAAGVAVAAAVAVAIGTMATMVAAAAQALDAKAADELIDRHYCSVCHLVDKKMVGPGFRDVARKYAGDANAPALLADRVRKGTQGTWGAVPMPPNDKIPDADLQALIAWILALK